jgi:hypothetical protein
VIDVEHSPYNAPETLPDAEHHFHRLDPSRKLEEVEALLERTKAMKGWLEVAKECGCETSDQCALFPAPGDESADPRVALTVVHVEGGNCHRAPPSA